MNESLGHDRRRTYHHGDLRTALLREAEIILERDGVQGLTLRAAARAAGVSHAAPTNHFGDLTGLLSELAAVGFSRFAGALGAAMAVAGEDPHVRINAMGIAYVAFARAHPGLFALMFRSERLDMSRPALRVAIDEARGALRNATLARIEASAATPLRAVGQAIALWSLVHGFSMLLLDGRLKGTLDALPVGADVDVLLREVLASIRVA